MSRSFSLPFFTTSAVLARRHVERFAAEEHLDDRTPVLALIATELVTNAVLHGAPPVSLTLRCEREEVTIEVADGDRAVADVKIPAPRRTLALGGNGLHLVAQLADRWGTTLSDAGKTVWASIDAAGA